MNKNLLALCFFVLFTFSSCEKNSNNSANEFTWEIDVTIDGERQHWKGTETYPNAPSDNWCLIDNDPSNEGWILTISTLKNTDASDWISGAEEFVLSLSWLRMSGTSITGGLFVGGLLSCNGLSYYLPDLTVNIVNEGTSPNIDANKWGSPFEIMIPSQSIKDGNNNAHTISGTISALRKY